MPSVFARLPRQLTSGAYALSVELRPGDFVSISASRFPFPVVLPLARNRHDWIDSITRTLQWNCRQRQKAFQDAAP